ncbi:MAG TPA: EI24 domain-containing protein, partial [Albitalea sp.]|nr:EI24 domain-containing protein [Albitalea sp.]
MNLLFDSFWRAAAYCLHPRVILLSLAPLLLMAGLALVLGYFFWESALDAVSATIASWEMMSTFVQWLDGIGLPGLKAALAPLVVVFVSTPVIVVVALLVVATMMTPTIVKLVADRRFPALERARGGSLLAGAFGALGATLVALLALVLSIPLWFVPPLVLIVPPLIWGWLTYRVMSYDVLAEHASADERRTLIRRHRMLLLGMGVLTGYLGAAPSLVWASGAIAIVFAPVLVPVAVWIYTLVFAFSSLWFAHYALASLQ